MKLELTENQKMIRDMVREFAEKEIEPVAAELDKKKEFPRNIIKKMGQLGLLGISVPAEYGGAGADSVSYAIAIEEISKKCASTGVITSVHNSLACYPIEKFGNEDQKEKYLIPLAKGEKLGSYALTEPNAGSDAAAIEMTAKLDGGSYILDGTKIFITSGNEADFIVVFVKTDKSKGSKGMGALIVEKGTKGLSIGGIFDKLGINAASNAELIFENCEVPKENLIGNEGDGFKIALASLDCGRIGIGAQAVGIAQVALEKSIEYAKQREQFGRPISKFQAIQWMIADMATRIEASRLLVYNAAHAKDQGGRFTKEAAMAKLFASETAMESTIKAVQIYGGYGYTTDYPVERYFRDAKITEIYEGTSEIQRLVIARSLLK